MSDPPLNLLLKSTFDPSGTDAALRALRQLQQAQAQAAKPSSGGDSGARQQADAALQAEKATLRYANALAASQRAQGDAAGAAETYRTVLDQLTPGTVEALNATTRLAQAENAVAKSAREAAGGAAVLPRTIAGLSHEALSAVQSLAGIGGALKLIGEGAELAQLGAKAQVTRASFDNLAKSIGTTGTVLLTELRAAAQGTISDAQLIESANSGILLTSGKLASDLPRLLEIARASARATGEDVGFVFDSLVKGIARGSPQIIDNAKITLDAAGAFETYAKSIGKTPDQLTRAEQQQATLNAVLAAGDDIIKRVGDDADSNAPKLQRLGAGLANIKAGFGAGLANEIAPVADLLGRLGSSAAAAFDGTDQASKGARDFGQAVADTSGPVGQILSGIRELDELFGGTAANAPAAASGIAQAGTASATSGSSAAIAASGYDLYTASLIQNANMATQATAAQLAQADSMEMATVQANAAALAAQNKADADQVAAVDAQTHAVAQNALAQQAQQAAQALLAAGPQGAATAAILAGSSQQVDVLTAAYYRLYDAMRQAGIKAAAVKAQNIDFSDTSDLHQARIQQLTDQQTKNRAATEAATQAQLEYQRTLGNFGPSLERARSELTQIAKDRGTNSKEYFDQLTKIARLEQQQESAEKKGKRGGRGGAKGADGLTATQRAKQAEQTGLRLEDIERASGNKLEDIDRQTQEKLLAIEKKYADQRAEQQRQLNDDIARMNASTAFDQQLNDFDKFQKDMSDEQKAALADREAAEVRYNERIAAAQEEARQIAQGGDAELADETLKIREQQAKQQQEIEEKAAEAKRNAGKGQAAAIDKEAAEATAANQRQADTEIAIAQAKAQQRAGAEQAEKDAVIAQANEQKEKVIAAAEEQATKVRKASGDQRSKVVSDLQAQAAALKTWADQVEADSARASRAMGSVQGPPASSGAGDGETSGGATDTGGDTGAGLQNKTMALRTAGTGGNTVASAIQTLNDAAEIIKVIKPFVAANRGALSTLNAYVQTVRASVAVLLEIQDLRERLVMPAPVLDVKQVEKLRDDVQTVVGIVMTIDMSAQNKVRVLAKFLDLEKAAIDILNQVIDLRGKLAEPTSPIDIGYVRQLFNEVVTVTSTLLAQMPRLVQREIDLLKSYRDGSANAVGILQDAYDLAKTLSEPQPTIPAGSIRYLAQVAAQATRVLTTLLVPLTQQQVEALKRYQDGAGAAIGLLNDTADIGKTLNEPQPAIPPGSIRRMALVAAQVLRVVESELVPTTEEQGSALARYTDAAGGAVSLIKDAAEIGKTLAEPQAPIPPGAIRKVARDAAEVTRTLVSEIVPLTDAQAEAAKRFADTEGAAVETIKNVLDLPAKMFTDYESPSDAQIAAVVKDADRVARAIDAAARTYDTKGLEAAKAFGEAIGATFGAFKDELLFFQALNSGDFVPNAKNLATFEKGTLVALDMTDRLAARAAKIPAGNIAALQSVTAAQTALYESMIKFAAIPFGNLPQSGGAPTGGSGGIVINIYNPPANVNVQTLIQQVKQGIGQQAVSRR